MDPTHKTETAPSLPVKHPLVRRLTGFVIAGGTGFTVDALVLTLLNSGFGIDPFSARIVAIAVAAFVTWQINRNFSWGRAKDGAAKEGSRYFTVVIASALVNYVVYSAALLIVPGLWPFIALVIGTAVAMSVSFFGFDRFVFRH